ncbi:MAG: DUF3127 domain-containing protein [Kiritimatiellia bacterium]|jgi:single-strand DNA-binding protein
MPGYEFVGTIKKIGDVQTFPSGFSKRELVVTSEGERYPQDIMFEFLKEKADMLTSLNEADRVKVYFDIGGREYNGRYYNSLKGWKIEKLLDADTVAPDSPSFPSPASASPSDPPPMPKDVEEDDDNLPF